MSERDIEVGSRIRAARQSKKITQKELADKIGISQTAIALWENGSRSTSLDLIDKIAEYLDIPAGYLLFGEKDIEDVSALQKPKPKKGVIINVLGRVAAGVPIEAITDIIDTEEITEEMARTGEFFGLQIKGDSMEPRMAEGDVVIVRQQDDAESGDIVIATINGDEATCKRLRKYRDGIELVSNNPSYEPMFFSNDDIVEKPVKIIGKVVELRAKF